MGCPRGCGGGRVPTPPSAPTSLANSKPGVAPEGMVLLEYLGPSENTLRFVGKKTQTAYRFGRTPEHRQKYVFAADAPGLLSQGWGQGQQTFRQVAAPVPVTVTAPLVVRDRVVPAEVKQEPAQTFDQWSKPVEGTIIEAKLVETPSWDVVITAVDSAGLAEWEVRPAAVEETLKHLENLIAIRDSSYTVIRNLVPTLSLEVATWYLAEEKSGKNRVGVVKLLQAHIAALSEQTVPA
jgi:hypothetical protein